MKIFFLVLTILIIHLGSTAQTSLEKLVFKELNAYRALNGEVPVIYSESVSKASVHHTKWMSLTDVCSHDENIDAPGFSEIIDVQDRGAFYKIWDATDNKEEIAAGNYNHSIMEIVNQTIARGPNPFVIKMKPEAQLAKDIIEKFSLSIKGHNEAMLLPVSPNETIVAGIGVIVKGEKAYTTINFIFFEQ